MTQGEQLRALTNDENSIEQVGFAANIAKLYQQDCSALLHLIVG